MMWHGPLPPVAHQLSEAEHSVLSLGPKFIPTPCFSTVFPKFAAQFESAFRSVPTRDETRAVVINKFRSLLQKSASNLTPVQIRAIRTLRNNPDISILQADKANQTVVMDTADLDNNC